MDDFSTEVDEHGNIKVTSHIDAVVLSKEEQEQALRIFEQLQDENAKLRELVKAFWWCTENFDIHDKCDQCPLKQSSKLECECEVMMRELGIEAEDV